MKLWTVLDNTTRSSTPLLSQSSPSETASADLGSSHHLTSKRAVQHSIQPTIFKKHVMGVSGFSQAIRINSSVLQSSTMLRGMRPWTWAEIEEPRPVEATLYPNGSDGVEYLVYSIEVVPVLAG